MNKTNRPPTSPRNPQPTNQPQPLPDLLDASPRKDPSVALAEQEREDAALDVAQLYELHLRARLRLEDALRAGATTEAKALTIHEARLESTRTHRAWELAEHDLLGAAKYGEAWSEKRAQYRRDGVGPHAGQERVCTSLSSPEIARPSP